MIKVSFSLSSSKNSSKPSNFSSDDNKQFITEFDPSKTPTNSKTPIIIPPIPNQWNPNSTTSNITYGINLRTKKVTNSKDQPMSAIDRLMLMNLKSDLKRLPDDRGLDEFDAVSVTDFASAYLKGYGWVEGAGIGKNAKEDVKVVEFSNTIGRQGLGFAANDNRDH